MADIPLLTRRADRLMALTRAAVPFAAGVVAWRAPAGGGLRPLCHWGYDRDVRRFLLTDFVTGDPGFAAVAGAPERTLFWEDVPGFADGATARTVLAPVGFREGTSMVLTLGDREVGVVHLSLAESRVPGHARGFLRSLRSELTDLAAAACAAPPAEPGCPLTDRELEVLATMAEGLTNRQIAARLHVSTSTVGTHVEHLYLKLGVTSRVGAVVAGLRRGLIA